MIREKFLGFSLLLSCFLLTGCVQDSPSSSKERTVSLLLELLRDEGPEMRRTAVESLGKIGDPRAVEPMLPLLERLAENPSPGVRAEAAYRLGTRNDRDTKAALEKAIAKDSDSGVRGWAKRGI